jgi:hypothetical protein
MEEEIAQLRWRRDGNGGLLARPTTPGPTYHIRAIPASSRYGKSWRLTVDGVNIPDAEGCILRHVKHRACTLAAENDAAAGQLVDDQVPQPRA